MSAKQKNLEMVVSRHDLSNLPKNLVKIVLQDEGVVVDPKKKLYKYGVESILEIDEVKMKICPQEDTVYFNNETFYIMGVVYIKFDGKFTHRQTYATPSKFLRLYEEQHNKK